MQQTRSTIVIIVALHAVSLLACDREAVGGDAADTAPAEDVLAAAADTRAGAPLDLPIYTTPVEAAPAPGDELPIEVVRSFDCVPAGVGAELIIGPVTGEPGAVVLIRPAAAAECRFDLVYRPAAGAEQVLSAGGGGYLFAAAVRAPSGAAVICANDIVHRADGGVQRYVDAVEVVCAASTGGPFGPLERVVAPDGAWAAWVRSLGVPDGPPGAFALRYVRDFSYHFFNMSDHGRPATDGVYEVTLTVDAAGALHRPAAPDARVGQRTNPLAAAAVEEWRPDAAEQAELDGVIDFSDGPCAKGCPTPP